MERLLPDCKRPVALFSSSHFGLFAAKVGRCATRDGSGCQGGSSLPRKMLGIEWLNSMLDNPESFCSSCANAQQNISCHGRRGSGGIGSSAAALGAARRASSVGATDERTPLFGERQPGWGTALLCGGVSRPMDGDAGLVGGGLSFES